MDENKKAGDKDGKESGANQTNPSAVQDLFNSMGIGFWKPKKKAASALKKNDETNDAIVLPGEIPAVDDGTIQEVQNNCLIESCEESLQSAAEENPESAKDADFSREMLQDEEGTSEEAISIPPAPARAIEKEPVKKGFKSRLFVLSAVVLVAFLGYKLYGLITEPRSPSEDVVATYAGKNLTKEELMTYINSKGYKEQEHGLCEKHGFEHDKCDKTEECETHPVHSLEAYNQIIKMIAVQKIVDDWAKENGINQKDAVQHDFKHLVEEVNLDSLVNKVHQDQLSPDKIDKLEIQKYYDANKDKYKDKPFSEVEDEIRNILAAEKDQQFFPEYIEKLRQNAGLSVNYDLLKVEPPTDTELQSYYEKNKEKYLEPEKAKILEIKVDISGLEEDARNKAEEALTKIRGGESFEAAAKAYSDADKLDAYYVNRGERGSNFEDRVFNLQANEVSAVFKDENSFFLVKVLEKQEERQKTFGEALDAVKAEVLKEKEDRQYDLKKDEALFSVHGKRFTLGEFKTEFKELSPETQAQFAGFEAKKNLIDQLISKELLLEESGDDSADIENREEIEELKSQYISQMLHKEEIDEKIGEISDGEVKEFYEKNKNLLVDPPKAQVSLIRVEQGGSDAEKTRARQRIDEALQKIKSGTDFAEVAKEYSSDATASAGGELNEWIFDDAYLDPVLRRNIFNLKQDEVGNAFEYEGGYYVVKLRQKEDKKQRTLEEVREELKEALTEEKHHKMEAELEDELLRKSQLVIYNSTLKKMLKEQSKKDQ
jgi:parvulin-like peptidyl-prolyl isomerase